MEYWSSGILEYWGSHHSTTPLLHHSILPFSLRHLHHQIHKRIHRDFVVGRYQGRGKRQLDHRWPFYHRAGAKPLVIVHRRVDEFSVGTGEKDLSLAFARGFDVALSFPARAELWLRNFAHGVHANLADLDSCFRVARADSIELLVLFLEGTFHFRHAFGVESLPSDRHFHSGGLTSIAHGKEAAKLQLVRLEALSRHRGFHLRLDRSESLVHDSRVRRQNVLAAHDASADHVGGRGAECREYRRGSENVNPLDT